ncbi:MAG: radical SAM protein, partial [bacterium]
MYSEEFLESMSRRPYSDTLSNLRHEQPEAEDYVFSFPLRSEHRMDSLSLTEMLGTHVHELLDVLVPISAGQEVQVQGFKLMNDRGTVHPLLHAPEDRGNSESDDPLEIYEPRIKYIQRILESLLALVDLEVEWKRVAVDGFRQKKPGQWLTPSGGPADILAHAASRCNLNCRFCYNAGSPPALKSRTRSPDEEHREIRARINHYTPGSRLSLFPNTGSPCEALAHPAFNDILAALRQKTRECIRIPTNGSLLTAAMIKRLAGHLPVFLDISLNSASP